MNLYCGKILRVNLLTKKVKFEDLNQDWADQYIGGKGLGFRYILEEIDPKIDPLSEDNKLLFFTGPFAGTIVPTSSRLAVITKSPATGGILDSYVGGSIAAEIKYAGIDAVIIEGKSKSPAYLEITDESINIHEANKMWGRGIFKTEYEIRRKHGEDYKVLSIGQAGENLIPFACITSESYRQAGRGGTGAVMGSKNLKGIAVRGSGGVKVLNMVKFLDTIIEIIFNNVLTDKNLWANTDGTPMIVDIVNNLGFLPTKNFQFGVFEDSNKLNSEAIKKVKIRNRACVSCPLACGKFTVANASKVEGPDYETLVLGGSNCGIGDIDTVIKFNEACDNLGLDTISAGNVIAFAMEMAAKGINNFGVSFGDRESFLKSVQDIALRKGKGKELAKGVRRLSHQFGGREFAMEVKGLEIPGYDPRGNFGKGLGYATSNRGACHLQGASISTKKPHDLRAMVEETINKQNLNSIKWSMILCDFWSVDTDIMANILNAGLGKRYSPEELKKSGEIIWNMGRIFNIGAGFTFRDDYLPSRVSQERFSEGSAKDKVLSEKDFTIMLNEYYKLRGWDKGGVPTDSKLKELGIYQIAKRLFEKRQILR